MRKKLHSENPDSRDIMTHPKPEFCVVKTGLDIYTYKHTYIQTYIHTNTSVRSSMPTDNLLCASVPESAEGNSGAGIALCARPSCRSNSNVSLAPPMHSLFPPEPWPILQSEKTQFRKEWAKF